jgi:RHS repeat-associated protein
MQLASSARIPDGLMAAMRLGDEKPHQGLPGRNPALYQGPTVCNSTTALGLRGQAEINRIGSCSTGKERDTESGNDYFGARYYASSMGRFLSPDWSAKVAPVPYAKLDDPQSLNLYAYVRNNPLVRIDPDGHVTCAGSKDYCAQIKTGLDLGKAAVKSLGANSKEGKAIQKVLDFYGEWGKDNGVHVSFETMKPGQTGSAVMDKDGSINIKFDMKQINASGDHSPVGGASRFGERVATVIHEGTHGEDERRWGHNPQSDKQEDWTEHNAYRNESYAVTGLGWSSANGQFYPGMSDKDREAAIDVDAKASDAAAGGK